ncbi:MAG: DUF4394 domain-containing protein [Gemmatimonadetes bacterium]|nr:DUF4394 domain-containing protein [Gemmatimonadota bacterium]
MNPHRRSARRALTFVVTSLLLSLGCGDGGIDITEPVAGDATTPDLPAGPAVVGDTIYALDMANRLMLFGSESYGTVSRVLPIRGVPIFHRIVGIDIRPSDGLLYGVGSDSRVYVIDPSTTVATPVSAERFTPHVSQFFDVHFAMAFDPSTDRIRLISAETRANWSINADNGTATAGEPARYAEDDPNETTPPAISGIAFAPTQASGVAGPVGQGSPCEDLMYAFDSDISQLGVVCDGDLMEIESLFEIPLSVTRCSEVSFDPDGNLFAIVLDAAAGVNRLGKIDPETGDVQWSGDVPHDSPIQDIAYPPTTGSSNAPVRSSRATDSESYYPTAPTASQGDLTAACAG